MKINMITNLKKNYRFIYIGIIILVILFIIYYMYDYIKDMINKKPIIAIAFFDNPKIKGTVHFTEDFYNNQVIIDIDLVSTFKNSNHGFHVHQAGDLSDGCISACAHFNPYNKKHGGPDSVERHVGDLGNIYFDSLGKARYQQTDSMIKLRGYKSNIIGRMLIIHEDEDDLGKGKNKESLITGNAGARVTCSVIGYSKKMFK